FHPCEAKCRRGQIDEPIAIKALKRYVADHAIKTASSEPQIAPPSGKSVAVVGAGPAGLTAAYYLAKLSGHAVTVFEALPEAGGMMRVGIPQYRLPKDVLDAEIDVIRGVGVEIKTNTRVDSLDSLIQEGYDAIFIALGAHAGTKMHVDGEDTPGVIDCVSMLRDVSLGKKVRLGERVAIIGGGNAAIDAARTALRIGAKEVTTLYRRTREEMPADAEEVEAAIQEGVNIDFLVAPNKIWRDNGHLAMECIRMKLGEIDASGRRRPEKVAGSEFKKIFDVVIAAIGQTPQIPERFGLKINRGGTLYADPDTLATDREGIFAGGDVVSGPDSVIEAIAAGRQAAISIDKHLGGEGIIDETLAPSENISQQPEAMEEEKHRQEMALLPVDQRLQDFDLIELGFSKEAALEEARRCLSCDLEGD
ncbi:MAG: FAD-dependent oxidoreductase, partial [Dehalococcoidia bacterium]|nr:FAD-dependent oxidoreductase [Dehalococcoidia bacterium]